MKPKDYSHINRFATILLTVVLVIYGMVMAQSILLPLAWAILLSLLILPLVQWLEMKMPRPLAIMLVLIIVTGFFGFILYLLSVQVVGVLDDLPRITQRLDQWMIDLQQYAVGQWGISNDMFSRQLATSVSEMINAVLVTIRNSLSTIFQTITILTVIPLYIYFMLYYRDLFYDGFIRIVKNYEQRAATLVKKINAMIQRYLSGMLLVTVIIGILFYLDLLLLNIKYALFFAVLLAVFNLIPYIGVIVSSLVVILYSLVTSGSLFYPLALLVSLWFIQFLENNFITPFVVGSRVKVNPLAALIAIFAGSSIWGISGMVLFLPLVGVLKTICEEVESLRPYGIMLGSVNPTNQGETDNT